MHALAGDVADRLEADGVAAGVVDPRFIRPLDVALLKEQAYAARLFVTIENGAVRGGFGSAVQETLADFPFSGRVLRFGWPDEFIPHGPPEGLAEQYGLTAHSITEQVHAALDSFVTH